MTLITHGWVGTQSADRSGRSTSTCSRSPRIQLAVRADPGPARHARPGRVPDPARQVVVGDPQAVRVAARAQRGPRARAAVARAAHGRRTVRVRHGILNIQYAYLFGFFFTTAHYYGAWVFTAAFAFHVALKLPTMRRSLAARRGLAPLRERLADTAPEPATPVHSDLIPRAPAPPTMSRRALLGGVGLGSLFLLVQGAAQSIGGPLRGLAFFAPRGQVGSGPNGFPVTGRPAPRPSPRRKSVLPGASSSAPVRGRSRFREPICCRCLSAATIYRSCVEGWSTTQRWTGVPIRELAKLVGER